MGFQLSPIELSTMLVTEFVPYLCRVGLILVQFRLGVPKLRTGVECALDDLGPVVDNVLDDLRKAFVKVCYGG